jgi:Zn-dependent metalloprotease
MSKKTTICAGLAAFALMGVSSLAQDRLAGSTVVSRSGFTELPNFIKLAPAQELKQENFSSWAAYALNLPQNSILKPYETFSDELGYTHVRHRQYVNGYPVEGTQVISHSKDGKIVMVNGDYYQNFSSNVSASLTEQDALQKALNKVNAKKYMWENTGFQRVSGYDFTPKGELVMVHKKDADYSAANMRLAYKFNIYAEVPLYRANVFVDASTGEILDEHNQICSADVVGQGVTKYSGTVTMTSDNGGGSSYTLNEAGRGNGIHTYNLNHSTTYTNTNFTNTSSTWNLAGTDKAASDAHWGAEMTYDYYKNVHSRNSIDGNGYALNSYMHYSNNYANAFWNGQCMSYGDGDGVQFGIMTALDVCGHEITHGLTAFTAGLGGSGSGEPGALNEAWSDIMGTSIEAYARPSQHDWLMGHDISLQNSQVRDLSNQHNSGEGAGPNCYMESGYWDAAQQEVHINSGPAGHWYYLLCNGGSGTSGCNNTYNVTAIPMSSAQKIAFRALTVYFTSNTNYANARTYTEHAATDLFGSCSAELSATSNAWYAVNVGGVPTVGAPSASFTTGSLAACTMPVAVTFSNTSTNAQSYSWTFGDGGTSTATAPTHTYTSSGTYTVTLVATGCNGTSNNTYTQSITISGSGTPLPLVEGFESSANLPAGWTLYNPDNDAAWQINTTVAKTGSHCMGFNNCDGDQQNDMTGKIDKVFTKSYDFSQVSGGSMTFDVAYAVLTYSGTAYNDKLDVLMSTDCGTTWTNIYSKSGSTLASAPGYTSISSCWTPTASTQWRNDAINLSAAAGHSNVMFAFQNTSAWGTWIYIDNINIIGTTGIASNTAQNGLNVYPNPAHDNLTVSADHPITGIQVIDLIGKTVILQDPNGEKTAQVDISSLPAGVYFVKVNAGETQKLVRIIKQ